MQAIAAKIQANLNLRVFLVVLVIALATTWYGLGPALTHFASLTGGLRFVDMQPTLTPATLLDQLRTYSPETVHFYLGWSLFDVAWPFVTYTAMLFITAWLLRFLPPAWQQRFWLFVGVAYTTVLMDWLENVGFSTLVLVAPAEPMWVSQLAVWFHRAKLFFNMVYNVGFGLVLLWAIAAGVRRRLMTS
ncbi:MAG: hypothetical protein ABIX37_10435 [Gammaproteobacteria bacterium]